jgi:hypothetical protein
MAMKETERSLRWYFLLAGGITVVVALITLSDLSKLPPLPTKLTAPVWYSAISRLLFGAGYLVAGFSLKNALLSGGRWIQHLVMASGASLILELVWNLANQSGGSGAYQGGYVAGGLIGIGVRIAIVAYLYANIRRLSAEAQARTAGTAFE